MPDIQTLSLILTLMGLAAGGVWKLSRVEAALRADINQSRDEIERKQERATREFGESAAAIRQKVHEVELWAANTFVRRDSFDKAQEDLKKEMKTIGDKLEARLERMEEKIDRKVP
ncbi:MAG: hypothetical protein AB7K04_14870 [Pseudorhodoplanes sp.]